MKSLRYIIIALLGFVGVLYAVAPSSFAEKYANATEEELSKALNKLSVATIDESRTLSAEQRTLDAAWLNPEIRSEEIDALRVKIFEIEQQLTETRIALREAIEQVPEIKARREKFNAAFEQQRQNRSEIEFLQQRLDAIVPQRR